MYRTLNHALVIASIVSGLTVSVPARAASVTQVPRSTWGATGVPSYVNMYIYVPDKLSEKPPVLAAHHSCGTPVSGLTGSIKKIMAAADANGFIIILPEATGQNCWAVGTKEGLTHDGGGDTQAVVQMVKYVLAKYDGDASRVYAMGGSSGAMMTQALLATYPDVFRAGSARAGVAAGCWADGYASSNQWSNNCAGGNTKKSAAEWGNLVRDMYKGYNGHRPRVQLFHATGDGTINYNNMGESIKEWTNVLGLPEKPTSTATVTRGTFTYDREQWKNACGYDVLDAWSAKGGTHSMPAYEEDDILAFFGLDQAGGSDPEPNCNGEGGMPGGGAGGSGGASGGTSAGGTSAGGTAPASGGGGMNGAGAAPSATGGSAGGGIGVSPMTGGAATTGGTAPTGGAPASNGGTPAIGTGGTTSGTIAATGGLGAGGAGGMPSNASGGVAVTAGPTAATGASSSGCAIGGRAARRDAAFAALGISLLVLARKRKHRS